MLRFHFHIYSSLIGFAIAYAFHIAYDFAIAYDFPTPYDDAIAYNENLEGDEKKFPMVLPLTKLIDSFSV